jgi:hypothetical protein
MPVYIKRPDGSIKTVADAAQLNGIKLPAGYELIQEDPKTGLPGFSDRPPVGQIPPGNFTGAMEGVAPPVPAASEQAPASSFGPNQPSGPAGMGDIHAGEGALKSAEGGSSLMGLERRDNLADLMPWLGGGVLGGLAKKAGGAMMGNAINRAGLPGKAAAALGKDAGSPMADESIKQIASELADKTLTAGRAAKDFLPTLKIGATSYGASKLGLPWWVTGLSKEMRQAAMSGVSSPSQEAVIARILSRMGPLAGGAIGTVPSYLSRPGEEE